MAKHYIWICRSKELYPTRNNFLIHLKHIHHLENRTPSNTKKFYPRWIRSPEPLTPKPVLLLHVKHILK